MSVHQGHRSRVKQRFEREGIDHFQDHQILEMLLFHVIPRRDTNEIAHRLIKTFGSFSSVLDGEPTDLIKVEGVGENVAFFLSSLAPVAKRYNHCKWGKKPHLNSSQKAGEYAMTLFQDAKYEAFYLICLDNRNYVNFADRTFEGTINEAPIYPRIVVETALKHRANTVILAHNHPGGSLKPSQGDIQVTKRIKEALAVIDVRVMDHIVVGNQGFFSFAEEGLL